MSRYYQLLFLLPIILNSGEYLGASDFEKDIRPFLKTHCLKCHGGEKVKGDVDFSAMETSDHALSDPELWELVSFVLEDQEMPPEDEPQPSDEEREKILNWYQKEFVSEVQSLPSVYKPRRLSAPEYRNTMHSLFGFPLEVNIIEAEQTVVEKSLVIKLLPTDPPGESGFVNDTHSASISTNIWDQYSYLADFALEQLFSPERKAELEALAESPVAENLTPPQSVVLLEKFMERAFRRPPGPEMLEKFTASLSGKSGAELTGSLKQEMKRILMSPAFLYRGHLMEFNEGPGAHPVDDYELAERLSYFLWEDMPDDKLSQMAAKGELTDPVNFTGTIDRMIASPKSRTLAESFGVQWLLLEQIEGPRKDPTNTYALRNQPIDFLYYLFTENRPVMELIDSKVTFANNVTSKYYPKDSRQLGRFEKPRGIERMMFPNRRMTLENNPERGGIITMPGVLAMNKGPILRGTWMLRQILGEHLGEPPPDVPPIKSSPKGQDLSFRERFEQHRADKSCALCHDKIDPLGFALEEYNDQGKLIGKPVDSSGVMPDGTTFQNFAELKQILLTGRRESIVRNAVEKMMAYALCRKLERNDRPTVEKLTAQIMRENGTWRDLIHGIAESVPFRQVLVVDRD